MSLEECPLENTGGQQCGVDRREASNKFIGEEGTSLGASERAARSPAAVLLPGLLLVFAREEIAWALLEAVR